MATAVIQINGATGSRSDLSVSVLVNLNDAGADAVSRLWTLLSVPPGSTATLTNPTTQTPSFTPDVVGSYRIQLTVNGSIVDVAIGAVTTTNLSIRIPATGEEDEFDESGNTTGWSGSLHAAFLAVDSNVIHAASHSDAGSDEITAQNLGSGAAAANLVMLSDGSGGWTVTGRNTLNGAYDEGGAGVGRTITVDAGPIVIDASEDMALELDGYVGLREISDPAALANVGHIYVKDDGTASELFYMDNYGDITQLTQDGYLNLAPGFLPEISDPTATPNAGFIYSKDVTGTSELFYMDSSGVSTQITGGGSLSGNTLDQAYDEGGAGAGRVVTADSGPIEINASEDMALELDGYIGLREISDPSALVNFGHIYVKDDGSGSELFYMDNYGNIVQLTQDGYTNLAPGYLPEISDPTAVTNAGLIYTKDDGGDTELYYRDDSGNIVQLTRDGATLGNTLDQAYDEGGAGVGRTITADSGAININASGGMALDLDGYISLTEISDPASMANFGHIYVKDDSGDSELYYMDNYGKIVQLTKDGYTNLAPGYLPEITAPLNQPNAGFIYTKDDGGDTELFYMDDGGAETQITQDGSVPSSGANTLNQAYDEGGAGVGRTITADAGPVEIDAAEDMALDLDGYISLENISAPSGMFGKGLLYTVSDVSGIELRYMDDEDKVVEMTEDGYMRLGPGYLPEISPVPTSRANAGFVYAKDDGGDTELFYMDDVGNEVQLTANGYINSTLDTVYDGISGSGSGKAITADSGAVEIDASSPNNPALFIDGYIASLNSGAAEILGTETDGAAAIGVKLGSDETYSTSGSKLLSVQNNTTERANIDYSGALTLHKGDNGQQLSWKYESEEITISTDAFTATSIFIPQGAQVHYVTSRVTASLPDVSYYEVGVSGNSTLFGDNISPNIGVTDTGGKGGVSYFDANTVIRVTPIDPPSSAIGTIRITIHYTQVTPPTS
jgi:hypothetical protein